MKLRAKFWERLQLDQLNEAEWEALCDGCGKCCLNKLEDEESGEVVLTRIACRLFDDTDCRCSQYDNRHQFVPDCIRLRPDNIEEHAYWLPSSCAYKRLWEGRGLAEWHPLISGRADTVHLAGVSIQNKTLPEFEIHEEEWEDHVIDEPGADL